MYSDRCCFIRAYRFRQQLTSVKFLQVTGDNYLSACSKSAPSLAMTTSATTTYFLRRQLFSSFAVERKLQNTGLDSGLLEGTAKESAVTAPRLCLRTSCGGNRRYVLRWGRWWLQRTMRDGDHSSNSGVWYCGQPTTRDHWLLAASADSCISRVQVQTLEEGPREG